MRIEIQYLDDGITLIITGPNKILRYSGLVEDEADMFISYFERVWAERKEVPGGAT